jgi:hypothetical protein
MSSTGGGAVLKYSLWALLFVGSANTLRADISIDFEGFFDGTAITNQYPDVSFSNAVILQSGLSLDEAEFPPHSGINVVSDSGGPMTIDFLTPVVDFSAFFTYAEMLTLTGRDASSNPLTPVTSLFSANYVSSGNPPNELISLDFAAGISQITITGDPGGSSFAMDDVSFTEATTAPSVPEPASWSLTGIAFGLLALLESTRRRFTRSATEPEANPKPQRTL